MCYLLQCSPYKEVYNVLVVQCSPYKEVYNVLIVQCSPYTEVYNVPTPESYLRKNVNFCVFVQMKCVYNPFGLILLLNDMPDCLKDTSQNVRE